MQLRVWFWEIYLKILEWLYGVTGVIASMAFLPQVVLYTREKHMRQGVSLLTWGIWSIASIIATLYAAIIAKDLLITAMTGLNAAFTVYVFILGCSAKFPIPLFRGN